MNNWIPVSERLPDKNCEVLATINYINPDCPISQYIDVLIFLTDEDEEPGFYHYIYGELYRVDNDDVAAWMPMPELYQKEA